MSGMTGAAAGVSAAGSIYQGASGGKKGDDGSPGGGAGMSGEDLLKAAGVADPMMAERGRYIKQLRRLMSNPKRIFKDPAFRMRMKAGQDIVTSSAAARGLLGSGNLAAELQAEGQRIGSDEMDKQFQRLALLSGATSGSPAEAAGILSGKYIPASAAPQGTNWGQIGEGLGGLGGLFDQWNTPTPTPPAQTHA